MNSYRSNDVMMNPSSVIDVQMNPSCLNDVQLNPGRVNDVPMNPKEKGVNWIRWKKSLYCSFNYVLKYRKEKGCELESSG
jgi:hypothetical protein